MCRMYLKHFKMEPIKHAINVIKLCMFLASLAIRGAFYLVPVCKVSRKFLKFMHKGEASQFDAIPDGYNDAMRLCNKNLKPPFAYFREQGHPQRYMWLTHLLEMKNFRKVKLIYKNPSMFRKPCVSLFIFISPYLLTPN